MIVFRDVTKQYGGSEPVLDNVNFEIDKGAFVYLIGPTGSGKTTIFRLIIRDLLPSSGGINIGEWDLVNLPKSIIPTLRRKVGVIFQDLKLLMDRTVVENVMLPLQFSGTKEEEARKKAEEVLISVGLEGKIEKFPMQLSGGERQRVAIARALVFDPEVLLADEPTGNLDTQTSFQILDLLKSINKRGTTIFMATHNDRIIEKTSDRVIAIEHGKLIHDKKAAKKDSTEEKDDKKTKEAHETKTAGNPPAGEDDDKKKGSIKLESLAAKGDKANSK
ncbi:MAG TPA: cell division ATP-binding protein FtsE [Patescibacteria group bacterium]|nr:cell division ATP-binding protein FtsE [Patescibacteria group bacterium]